MSIELETAEQVLLEDIRNKLLQVRNAYTHVLPEDTDIGTVIHDIPLCQYK